MTERQSVIVGFVAAYVVAIAMLAVSRIVLNLPAEVQFLLPVAGSLVTLYVASVVWPINDSPRWWSSLGGRRGGRMLANAAVIFTAVTLTNMLRESRQDNWPVVAVGVGLPLFLVAQIAIDWRSQRLDHQG